jgi:hypothetical protein
MIASRDTEAVSAPLLVAVAATTGGCAALRVSAGGGDRGAGLGGGLRTTGGGGGLRVRLPGGNGGGAGGRGDEGGYGGLGGSMGLGVSAVRVSSGRGDLLVVLLEVGTGVLLLVPTWANAGAAAASSTAARSSACSLELNAIAGWGLLFWDLHA